MQTVLAIGADSNMAKLYVASSLALFQTREQQPYVNVPRFLDTEVQSAELRQFCSLDGAGHLQRVQDYLISGFFCRPRYI